MLTDHLSAVLSNTEKIFSHEPVNRFYEEMYLFMLDSGLNIERSRYILQVVSLLHDIAKPIDNKSEMIEHPFRKTMVSKRHQVLGVITALELLADQDDLSDEEKRLICQLIDEHDTPYSWYRQFERNKVIPEFKSWKKLDEKMMAGEDYHGIIMLALFKMADIHGHESVNDVTWFADNLNKKYLSQSGKYIPVPDPEHIR